MEESDKTTALKKAYAEIILNTAKESAARVMLSDRQSARLQHDLFGTKEEALCLLVRLKQMIDAKTIEAEIISSNQQRQIDVLEAQLQEAEDIITDLRSDLRWVRDKLEKAKVNELQARNVVNKEEENFSAQNVDPEVVAGSLHPTLEVADACLYVTSYSLLKQSPLQDDECGNGGKQFDGLSVNTVKGFDVRESELDVDIRNIKLELSKNGCTQRIHALERKTSPSAIEVERRTPEEDSEEKLSSGRVNRHETGTLGNTRSLVLALRSSNAEVIPMPTNALGIKKTSKSRKLRGKRKTRWGKRKATSARTQSQLIKPCQSQFDLPFSKTSMENSDSRNSMKTHISVESEEVDAFDACKGLEEYLQLKRTLFADDISIIRKRKRSKNMENLGDNDISSTVNASEDVEDFGNKADTPENETTIQLLPCLDPGFTSIKINVDPTIGSTNVTVDRVKATNRSTDKDLKSRKEEVLVNCKGKENSVVPSTKMGSELVTLHCDSEATAVVSDQISESPRTEGNRLVKYTFQRKRKRDL